MEVGAISAVGVGPSAGAGGSTAPSTAPGAAPSTDAAGGTSAGNPAEGASSPQSLLGTFLEGTVPAGEEMLTEAFRDLTSIDLLIALMLLAALLGKDDEECNGCGAALGFLAGMALAGQLGSDISQSLTPPAEEMQFDSGVGGNLNTTA